MHCVCAVCVCYVGGIQFSCEDKVSGQTHFLIVVLVCVLVNMQCEAV